MTLHLVNKSHHCNAYVHFKQMWRFNAKIAPGWSCCTDSIYYIMVAAKEPFNDCCQSGTYHQFLTHWLATYLNGYISAVDNAVSHLGLLGGWHHVSIAVFYVLGCLHWILTISWMRNRKLNSFGLNIMVQVMIIYNKHKLYIYDILYLVHNKPAQSVKYFATTTYLTLNSFPAFPFSYANQRGQGYECRIDHVKYNYSTLFAGVYPH